MRFLVFLIFILSVTAYAQSPLETKILADEALTKAQAAVKDAENKQKPIQIKLESQKVVIENIQKELSKEENYLNSQKEAYSKQKGAWWFFQGKNQNEFVTTYEIRKRNLKALETARKAEENALKTIQKDLEKASDIFNDAVDSQKDAVRKFGQASFELFKVQQAMKEELMDVKFLTLEHELVGEKLENVGLELEHLRNKYDTTMIGNYMRDRMLKLLNSNMFCDKAKACSKGENIPVIESDLNSVFPGLFIGSTQGVSTPSIPDSSTTTK